MAVFRFFKMAAPSYWDCVTPLEKDRATSLGNIRKKFRKDRACAYGSGDILADRQTDRHTDVLITTLRHRSCGRSNSYHIECLKLAYNEIKIHVLRQQIWVVHKQLFMVTRRFDD